LTLSRLYNVLIQKQFFLRFRYQKQGELAWTQLVLRFRIYSLAAHRSSSSKGATSTIWVRGPPGPIRHLQTLNALASIGVGGDHRQARGPTIKKMAPLPGPFLLSRRGDGDGA
jgi:hypothetical protein